MPNKQLVEGDIHDQVLYQFSVIYEQLSKISYIQHTVKKLDRILDDAKNPPQILFIGNGRAGKSTIINALLGRNIIPLEEQYHADVHIFIKYSEREYVEMTFLDGFSFEFDLNKLEILLNTTTEIGEILREHIDFITIYISNELLQTVTFIDGQALAVNDQQILYFPHRILNRADELFWIAGADQALNEAEQLFFKKMSAIYKKPYFIINKLDTSPYSKEQLIKQFSEPLHSYIENTVAISASKHIESKRNNNMQSFIDSNFTVFKQLILTLSMQETKKNAHTYTQLSEWIKLLTGELQAITAREPYASAIQAIIQYERVEQLTHSKKDRNLAIIQTFELDYKQATTVFENVQTLYQLLQTISENVYFRNEVIDVFEELATSYLQSLRSYRTLLSEYELQQQTLQKEAKFTHADETTQFVKISVKSNSTTTMEQLQNLNDKQKLLFELRQTIYQFEQQIEGELHVIEEQLNSLVEAKLAQIYEQVDELNEQQLKDQASLQYAYTKVSDFLVFEQIQQMLSHDIKPRIVALPTIYEKEKDALMSAIDALQAVTFQQVQNDQQIDPKDFEAVQVQFKDTYTYKPLKLIKENVISTLPNVPKQLKIE